MDPGSLFAWAVGFLAAGGLLSLLRTRGPGRRGWIGVHAAVLAILCVALILGTPDLAGPVAGAAWVLFILAPLLTGVVVRRLVARRRYGPARAFAAAAAALHPLDGWTADPGLIRDLDLLDRGDAEAARAILDRARVSRSPLAQSAPAVLFQQSGDWSGLKAWAEAVRGADGLLSEPVGAVLYVRALGELGETEAMAEAFALHEGRFSTVQGRDLARLFLFAYGGRPDAVRRLFETTLRDYPPATQAYFLGIAETAAGALEPGRARLEALTADPQRAAARRRLAMPPPPAPSAWTRALLDAVERRAAEERRFDPLASGPGKPVLVGCLVGILAAAFLATEVVGRALYPDVGGSMHPASLIACGAVAVIPGEGFEPWRLFTSLFLHFGALHLTMNALALLLFGPFVERALGRLRMLAVYLGSGLAGSLGAVALMRALHPTDEFFLVGASGCIFGLLGATAAHLHAGWRVEGAEIARQRLGMIAVMVVAQAAFDFKVLGLGSFTAHMGGLVAGFLLTKALRSRA